MIRIGIIGCGTISMVRHIPEYAANPECELTGYYDFLEERAQNAADLYGGKVYTSVDDLLACPEIDAVSVCTANAYHAPVTVAAFNAGKHVLCEKPIATSTQEAMQMIKAAKQAGKILMVGHNQRLVDSHKKTKEILQSGEMGRLLTFRTTFGHGGPESWTMDKSINSWFFRKDEAAFGVMGDLGIHKIDLIRWLVGAKVQEVRAIAATLDKRTADGEFVDVDDNATALLKFDNGVMGVVTVSWTHYGCEDNSTILCCEKGVIKMNSHPQYALEIIKKDGEKRYYEIGQIQTNDSQTNSGIIDLFVDTIISGKEPEISGEEGLLTLQVIEACNYSAKTGETVTLP